MRAGLRERSGKMPPGLSEAARRAMPSPAVIVEREGAVLVVTLNRPEKKNAVNCEVMCRLYDAWVELDRDEQLRVAILTGRGETFCAGMDLKAFANGEGPSILEGPGGFAGFTHYPRTKPCIAAVNGVALAGGC